MSDKSKRSRTASQPRHARLSLEVLESRFTPYSASGNAWINPELITIGFVPYGTIVGANASGPIVSNLQSTFDNHSNATFSATWKAQILKAVQLWAQQTNINFAVITDNGAEIGSGLFQQGDPNMADIRIGGYDFASATVAQAFAPPPVNNYSIAGDVQFNTGKTWQIGAGPNGTYDLFTVSLHEVGHALGLYHSNSSAASMWASYNGVDSTLNIDDINGIRNIYSGNAVRANDVYDAVASNGTFATATLLTPLADLTSLVTGTDLSTTTDKDFYRVIAPLLTNGTMEVKVQGDGLSLVTPKVTVYAADQTTVLGTATALGDYDGSTLTLNISVSALSTYYIKVEGGETGTGALTAFNTGKYGLTLNFGTNATPVVPLAGLEVVNGNPLQGGGGQALLLVDEFRVNTTTANTQTTSQESPQAVAMDANGNSVVVWSSSGQDGSGYGVYAQRYNPGGQALGSEFRVNTTTANDQLYPAVAMAANGSFVITWTSDLQDGSGNGIYAQHYNASGVAQGSEFRVNTTTTSDQMGSTVVVDGLGNFIIAWSSYQAEGTGADVFARRYNSSGVAQGSEFRVNTTTTGDQDYVRVAADSTGNFVVVWSSYGQDGSGYGVYGQRFNVSGVKQGSEFRVANTTAGDQDFASVAMDAAGNFVVTWSSYGQDTSSSFGVYARRFSAAGAAIGNEFRVNTTTTGNQQWSTVDADSNGNFLVTWSSYGQDVASSWGVYGQQYSAAGAKMGTEFQVSTTTAGDQKLASVGMSDNGRAMVVWTGSGTGDASGIYAKLYLVNQGNGLSNMEAGVPHGYGEHGCGCEDHAHHEHSEEAADGCGCGTCSVAVAEVQPVAAIVRQVSGTEGLGQALRSLTSDDLGSSVTTEQQGEEESVRDAAPLDLPGAARTLAFTVASPSTKNAEGGDSFCIGAPAFGDWQWLSPLTC